MKNKLVSLINRRFGDIALMFTTGIAVLMVLLILSIIIIDVVINGSPHITLKFLTSSPSNGLMGGGIFPAIFGTSALVILMTVAVIPAGIATAIYLNEYSKPNSRLARVIRIAIINLSGVPSIVFGLFGLGFFIQFVGRGIDSAFFDQKRIFGQPALIWAALTMAILTLPVVIVSVEEALRAVPNAVREASYALGATRFQTVKSVVIPQASAGILTGSILAVSRGAGEVAPILFTGVAYFLPSLPTKINSQFMSLGYHIYVLSTQSPDVDATKPILYATVAVLLALTILLNLGAVILRIRMRKVLREATW
jgi:phosphate transport system permease protein